MSFFRELLSARNPISSKRFISLVSLFLLVVVVFSALFGISVSESIIYSLVTLILGSSVATLVQPPHRFNNDNEKMPNL